MPEPPPQSNARKEIHVIRKRRIGRLEDSRFEVADLVCGHQGNGLRPKDTYPAKTSAVQQRLQQRQVIRRCGIDAASARNHIRNSWFFQRLRNELSIRIPYMQAGLTRALFQGDRKAGVVHAERARDVIDKIAIEALPTRDFDHPAGPVETAAIGPFGARLEHQRRARQVRITADDLEIAHDIGIPKPIAEPRRVRQQMAQRHGHLRQMQLRNTFRVEAGEHLGRSERRIDVAGRLVKFQLAALHELQRRDRRQQFDHRGDAEDRIARHRRRRGHVAEAERALIDDRLFVGGHRDNAGYFPGADFCSQRSIYFLTSGRPARRCGATGNRRGRCHACGRKRRCPQ